MKEKLYINKLHIEKFRLFENKWFNFGKRITAISGQNAVGKSTILGLIGNIVEDKNKNIFGKQYRTEFSEIFKASPEFDKSGEHKGTFYLNKSKEVKFRSTWQNNGKRFRIIPDRIDEFGKKVASKLQYPVIYLGLSRLYPIGETNKQLSKDILNLSTKEKDDFIKSYLNVLTKEDNIKDVTNLKSKEVKSNFTGISTDTYDAYCNSAGQDNLGQILLSLISFERLKNQSENWKGGLFIIDELDATLHPIAQQKLIEFLFRKAKKFDLQVVFTTHSLSVLEHICNKYENKKNFGEDYKLIHISTANEKVSIFQNPKYDYIKNNLCLTLSRKKTLSKKLLVFSEDDTTRWFFKKLIHGYKNKIKLINVNLGCSQLEKLLKEDPKYFGKTLFVVDGDVKLKAPKFVSKKNVIALPGEQRPEKMLYEHLKTSTSFWTEEFEQNGMTKQYFLIENGPLSDKYKDKSNDREKFSSWFYDQKEFIDEYKMFEDWREQNNSELDKFRNKFVKSYNELAKINDLTIIDK